MKFEDRYSTAIRAKNLRSDPNTRASDPDILGAAGLAGRTEPLAMALLRLFAGDNHASVSIVATMSEMAWGKAQVLGVKLKRVQADDLARAVLAWHRDGVCKACNGHGYALIEGSPGLSANECPACRGTGKVPFDKQFRMEWQDVARWLCAEIERESGRAGPAAMSKLAPRLDF